MRFTQERAAYECGQGRDAATGGPVAKRTDLIGKIGEAASPAEVGASRDAKVDEKRGALKIEYLLCHCVLRAARWLVKSTVLLVRSVLRGVR